MAPKKGQKKQSVVAVDLAAALKSGIKAALTGGGGLLGGLVGAPAAGSAAGAWLSKITGFGDYKVNNNSLMRPGVPTFSNGERKVTISHREYITDIQGSSSFTISSYALNPGNANVFPWLSSVADNYQQYRFKGLIFEFVSSSASALNSTNTALGTVILATNYNVARPNFASKIEMEASEFACRCKPCDDIIHPIECNPEETTIKHLYVRTGPVPSGQDQRFYDLGNFQVATVGMQASANIGELWVSYEVELLKPRLPSQIAGVSSLEWAWRQVTTYSNADPFNTGGLSITTNGGLGVLINNLTITFPSYYSSGTFYIVATWVGSSTLTSMAAPSISANAGLNTQYHNGSGWANSSGTETNAWVAIAVNINSFLSTGTTVTFGSLTLPTSGTYAQLFVMPAPSVPNSSAY